MAQSRVTMRPFFPQRSWRSISPSSGRCRGASCPSWVSAVGPRSPPVSPAAPGPRALPSSAPALPGLSGFTAAAGFESRAVVAEPGRRETTSVVFLTDPKRSVIAGALKKKFHPCWSSGGAAGSGQFETTSPALFHCNSSRPLPAVNGNTCCKVWSRLLKQLYWSLISESLNRTWIESLTAYVIKTSYSNQLLPLICN